MMKTLFDFTTWQTGNVVPRTKDRVEVCPVCGRPAWTQRQPPSGGRYPAQYVHRTFVDDETLEEVHEQCCVQNAQRADGLTHEEASEITAWIRQFRRRLTLLESAVGLGWYERLEDGAAQGILAILVSDELPAIQAITSQIAGRTE